MNTILEQLKKEKENALSHQYDNESSEGYLEGINKAIEIVKNLNTPAVTDSASKQVEIIKQRLHYHFAKTDGTWDIPKGMPFMKEFLNEVKKLCDIFSVQ